MNLKLLYSFFLVFLSGYGIAQHTESPVAESPEKDPAVIINRYRLGEGIRFSSADNTSVFRIGGYIRGCYELQEKEHVKDLYSRFFMQDIRLFLSGEALSGKLAYNLEVDFDRKTDELAQKKPLLTDAVITYRPTSSLSFSFGQRNTPTDNREWLIFTNTLALPERSELSGLFGTYREVGIFINGSLRIGRKSLLKPSFAITDGDGAYTFSRRHGSFKYGGRLDWLPFGAFRQNGDFCGGAVVRELTPKLIVGIHGSYNRGISDSRGRESGIQLYYDDKLKETLPDYTKYGADLLFKYRGFTLLGELIKTEASVPGEITGWKKEDGTISSDFNENTEQFIKERMILGTGINLQAGYMFVNRLSLDFRYTHLEPEKHSLLNDIKYNRNDFYEAGISQYLTASYAIKIQASATYSKAGSSSLSEEGAILNRNDMTYRFLFQFTF